MLYRRSYLFRLASDPVCYLWSGSITDLELPPDTLDPAGATYKAAGAIIDIPSLKQLINGIAERVDFSVSGVSAETLRLALDDRESIRGAAVRVGYVEFDEDWQIDGAPVWDWRGIADILTTESSSGGDGRQRSITLSVAADDTLRSNPALAYFTDADQRKRSPDDAIFDHVSGISVGTTRRFGGK